MIKKSSSSGKDRRFEKGQSLVEMALSATLLVFLLLAAIDFGYGFLYWIAVRDAAQEGAMYGSLHSGDACRTTLRNWVREAAGNSTNRSPIINLTTLPDAQINVTRTGASPGNSITVQVFHYYHILTPMVSNTFGATCPDDGTNRCITLSSSVTNTILQVDDTCP